MNTTVQTPRFSPSNSQAANLIAATPAPIPSGPIGARVMTIAPVGTGKTHSIRTLAEQGVECFVLATEPGIESVLGDTDPNLIHWNYLPPVPLNFDSLFLMASQINTMDFEALTKLKAPKNEFRQMLDFVNLMRDFKCQRTGKSYGPINHFDHNKAFVVDTLSGLTLMATNSFVGTRPALGPSDYGVIQKLIESTINSLCMSLRCWFILNSHAEKETNELTGATDIMASTIGRKLAPKLGRYFDEVLYFKRDGEKFVWSNQERGVDLKKRMLPGSPALDPSFKQLVHAWRQKHKIT